MKVLASRMVRDLKPEDVVVASVAMCMPLTEYRIFSVQPVGNSTTIHFVGGSSIVLNSHEVITILLEA